MAYPLHTLTDRELLLLILIGNDKMALDLTALNAAVSVLQSDVATLISDANVTPQSAIDAVTASVTALDATVKAALPPAPPAPPTGPASAA